MADDNIIEQAVATLQGLWAEVQHLRSRVAASDNVILAIDKLHEPMVDSEWLVKRCTQCDMEWPCQTHLMLLDYAMNTLGGVHK